MDRFIDEHGQLKKSLIEHLKSNMDRFIAAIDSGLSTLVPVFKIQYG